MSKLFISFLGTGKPSTLKGYEKCGYDTVQYSLDGQASSATPFVQTALVELLGPKSFDRAIILATGKSRDRHWSMLSEELAALGVPDIVLYDRVTENMGTQSQWQWFEAVLRLVHDGDSVVFDFTHGFRAVPIVLSAAVGFLQRARNVDLDGVYYGSVETDGQRVSTQGTVVDMKEFYVINEWAESVSRLVHDADTGQMVELSQRAGSSRMASLNREELIKAMRDLTDCIRNVDVNRISSTAHEALTKIRESRKQHSPAAELLLDLLEDKFCGLASDFPPSGRYTKAYYEVQLKIIEMLLKHRLYMQAFTAMREFVGSVGMPGAPEKSRKSMESNSGRKGRRYADIFVNMVQFECSEWKFETQGEESRGKFEVLLPYYETLSRTGITDKLHSFVSELTTYRNGFDHAWVSKSKAPKDIEHKGREYIQKLHEVFSAMEENKLFDDSN